MRYSEIVESAQSHNENKLLAVRQQVIDILKPNRKDLYGFCSMISVAI